MTKLDIKDRKILYYLSENARISNIELARKVGLGKNSVSYRINKLRKEGVIKHFATTINLGSLGLTTFTLLLKFNDDIYEKKEIIDYFKNHPFSDWVITLSGNWDLFVEMVSRDFMHMNSLVSAIIEKFSQSLNTYRLFFSRNTLRVEHLPDDFYKDLELEQLPIKQRAERKNEIDETDARILKVLSTDSALHYLEIAQRLDITIDIVRYRMNKMLENGIIVKFFPEIDLKKLGYTKYLCTIKLKNLSNEKMQSIKNRLRTENSITYAFTDIAEFSMVFVCAFRNSEEIDHLLRNLRKNYSEVIESQEYLIIKEEVLFNLFPDGISGS